ncbi:GIY-YIG nuclease family protein [Jejuia spongiicola]|uniref:GIY-YIG nuclease family protein n=1 Tax=Jejuia spongiicola TaxID=2942207 RepID=A0ABT0QAC7_9FLAO|nr:MULTISPECIES: GIY-YIG nuclease family protein [Flavobacteriaceae]MCL6293940.1 GIY-YIG nuclease family protein [Jejuia spongiicola]PIA78531.1 endonuclease [Gaetbulibacter sp. 4G1]
MKTGFVYILSNKNRTVLYIGATGDLKKRIELHVLGKATVFTKKYSVNELLYFEEFQDYHDAFLREKQLKNWRKEWKWHLIELKNPELKNLYLEL